MDIGIESIAFYVPHYFLDMRKLAEARGVDAEKHVVGLGQEKMAVPPPGEDVVTMAANAAERALETVDRDQVEMVVFATESSVDQSKAAGIYVHALLGLQPHCRVFETKQACYAATAGLQAAAALIARRPKMKALIVAADVARYGLGTPGEPTQGAGAVAMVVSADPKVLVLEPESGTYTEDVMDFWRPNSRDEALVDGKYSVRVYLRALAAAWKQYSEESGREFTDIDRFCYHLPFTTMAEKAHTQLAKVSGHRDRSPEQRQRDIADSLVYNRIVGNTYAASLYIGLTSLLENAQEDLTGKRVSLFSYGSGCVAEFFSGVVPAGYRSALHAAAHREMLDTRVELSYDEYVDFYLRYLPKDPENWEFPAYETGSFRLRAIRDYKRIYERAT